MTVIGSPYGIVSSKLFMNVVANGTVCNILTSAKKDEPTVLLTDARCLPGMEGGLMVDSDSKVVGVRS